MIKSKFLVLLLILFAFTAMISLSVCADHDSDTSSIYNSTEGNSVASMDNSIDNNSALSIYNSTDRNTDKTEDVIEFIESGNVLSDNSHLWFDNQKNAELIELKYEKVPIDDAYSRDKLGNINVTDGILEAFTRFGLWLDEEKVDVVVEDTNIMYIDDDLRAIENYWVFATRPESKESRLEKIKNSKSKNPSSEEMVAFLEKFDEKYPLKYVYTGVVLFITVENKETLLSEISEEDLQMLEAIKNVLLEKKSMDLKWGSSNPNVHLDMSGTAAKKVGFNEYYINMIANNAAVPDDVDFIENINGFDIAISFTPPFYILNGLVLNAVEYFYLKNYNHYYNPTNGFGGAIDSIEWMYYKTSIPGPKEKKSANLSYSSHYMADLSMPLHTNYAITQAVDYLNGTYDEEPHFTYENDYVGANWTTGHNFSQYSKNENSYYPIYDLEAHSKYLANFSYGYSDEAWNCGVEIANGTYTPSSLEFNATRYCIIEGQRSLNGLMLNGRQLIKTDFTNRQNVTLQLGTSGNAVPKVDLTQLRVSLGAGDTANISLNGYQILKFVDSSAGGNLYVYDENGNQLDVMSQVNGKPAYENVTFDVSFIHSGSEMFIQLQKYDNGVFNGSHSYSYTTNSNMLTLGANMTGYQSNMDYISSEYDIYHENSLSGDYLNGFFEKKQDTGTFQLEKSGYRVRQVALENLRVSMGAGDSANISLNGRQILKFVDSSAGGNLYIYGENGTQLDVIYQVNGKPAYENVTFDVFIFHDKSNINIAILIYDHGIYTDTYTYSYATNSDISTLRANMIGYQSNADYISGQYWVLYEA
ncbi:hypothetical protein MmiHf6_12230 [Methanimicrococcus hongohii]|uniref:Uncharacterized protein n=1 Tax=Methanimicrococcus hongohii TaxID=3028295 RepID=A0AA96ZSX8_9EURY|nr:hypothetical protein [Methanimicrococcus sp. Hf6]WNY23900.1 hypothetical protein MmiHf6_12230 [Methanimicrococcus sp. Hf6]